MLSNPGFGFDARPTSATYVNPNTRLSGDGFATFLIGAVAPHEWQPERLGLELDIDTRH